jgi:glycosyltransferase involved in cell wall biosynthesis
MMIARNAAPFVAAAIESALAQTFADFELVVVDDASTDQTADIIASYAAKDPRIRLIRRTESGGGSVARNMILREARGEWIAVLDADDLWRPRRLELQLAAVDANPSVVLVNSEYDRMDVEGRALESARRSGPEWWLLWQLLFGNIIGGHSQVLYRRELALACGGYRPEYEMAEDYQLWVDLTREGGVVCVPEVLMDYRVHEQSVSARKPQIQRMQALGVSDRAITALLGDQGVPEHFAGMRYLLLSTFPAVDCTVPQLAHNLRNLERAFWRRRPGLATVMNRLMLAYRIRWQWARYTLFLFKAGRKRESFSAGIHLVLG